MTSSDDEMALSPNTFIEQSAQKVVEQILPPKSKHLYLNAYENFMRWRSEKQVTTLTESVFLTYFDELSKKLQPSTLWSTYSMLRSTMLTKNNVNIKDYTKLASFLKRLSVGHKSKKSKVFTAKQVKTFLNTAPDDIYLATKVINY